MGFLDPNSLMASLIWSTIGSGFIYYGRKAGEIIPALGGVGIVAVTCIVSSVAIMSGVSITLLAAVFALKYFNYW